MKLPIVDITPFTWLDYPGHTACILWFAGCNFRCAYCHNPELLQGRHTLLNIADIHAFLQRRAGLLDGVVMSGGECTLSDALPQFAREIKDMGFRIKIDTNGSRPDRLQQLLSLDAVDCVALDYKAPLRKLPEITGWYLTDDFEHSLDLLCDSNVELEIRSTVHSHLLDENDLDLIVQDLVRRGFRGRFCLQNFRAGKTLGDLPPQARPLGTQGLQRAWPFTVEFRNFDNLPAAASTLVSA